MVSTRILIDPVGLFSSISLNEKYGVFELLDDRLDHRIDRRVVSALEARHLERHEIRVPGVNLAAHTFWLVLAE
jgi:hypothetical protein